MIINEDSRFYKELNRFDTFYIFGTAFAGEVEWRFLNHIGVTPSAFIVSGDFPYPETLRNTSVKTFDEISLEEKKTSAVLIGRPSFKNDESIKILRAAGFHNVFPGGAQWFPENPDEEIERKMQKYNALFTIDKPYVRTESSNSDVIIYACASDTHYHNADEIWDSPIIKYVQGGAKTAQNRICDIGDDTGINISEKNNYYNELSVGYWAHMNDDKHSIIGLYHYSRGLDVEIDYAAKLLETDLDAILPIPHSFVWGVDSFTSLDEQEIFREALKHKYPEYMDSLDAFLNNSYFCESNLLIAKKSVYDEYYRWMFDLFDFIENYLNDNNLWRPRITAYIAEHMYNVFFLHNKNKFRIAFAPIKSLYKEG